MQPAKAWKPRPEERKPETLEEEVKNLEQEARMILPGIQALFGFQLIAVFNNRFPGMPYGDQIVHLIALLSTAIATLCVLTPAAYHRQAEKGMISTKLTEIGTRFLIAGLVPLTFGICLDVYVITRLITSSAPAAIGVSTILFTIFVGAWFVYPRVCRLTR